MRRAVLAALALAALAAPTATGTPVPAADCLVTVTRAGTPVAVWSCQ